MRTQVEQRDQLGADPLAEEIDRQLGLLRAILHAGKLGGDRPEGIDGQDLWPGLRPTFFRMPARALALSDSFAVSPAPLAHHLAIVAEARDDLDGAAGGLIQRTREPDIAGGRLGRRALKLLQRLADADEAPVQRAASMPDAVAAAWKVCSWVAVTPRLEARSPSSSTRFRLFRMKAPAAKAAPVTAAANTVTRAEVEAKALPTSASPRVRPVKLVATRPPAVRRSAKDVRSLPNCAAKLLPDTDPAKGLLELPGRALAFLAQASELAQDLVATLEADRLVDDIAAAGHQVLRKFWA